MYLNLFNLEETDDTIAQITLTNVKLRQLIDACPSEIPHNLSQCTVSNSRRKFPKKLQEHPKFNDPQVWVVERKKDSRAASCSGCLKKGAIKEGDLHLSVKGLFYVSARDTVVDSTLRFEMKASCARYIRGTRHNIRDIQTDMEISCNEEMRNNLSEAEKRSIQDQGFVIS